MKKTNRFLSIVLAILLVVGMLPISAIAADTGETYTLTIKYAIEDSNGVKIGTEIADKVITGIAPGTVIDLSDYWPDKMSVTDSNGTTCWFLNHSKDSDNKDSHSGRLFYWVADKNETIYAHYENWHAPYELTLDPNGGTVNCQKILCLQHPFIYLSSEGQLIPVRDGYKFLGWSLDKNELSNQHVVVEDSGILYAIWEKLPSVQVGMTTLYDGEYTTDGRSTTTTKPESGGYAYFRDGVLTLNNFEYVGSGTNDPSVIYSEHDFKINIIGANTITAATGHGIFTKADLDIYGDGVLNINIMSERNSGIYGLGTMTLRMQNISLNVYSTANDTNGVRNIGNLIMDKVRVTIDTKDRGISGARIEAEKVNLE